MVDTENEGDVAQEDFQTIEGRLIIKRIFKSYPLLTFDLYQPLVRLVSRVHCLYNRPLVGTKKLIFLFLNENICCRYSKEPSR